MTAPDAIDPTDRALLQATQEGLPLTPRPYHAVAERLGLDPEDVMARFRRLLAAGVIRRMGAVPNHYGLGVRANGMSVWDVDDQRIGELGPRVGELPFVTHCYRRPRRLPLWPYNLFAMVHGRTRDEVEAKARQIALVLGEAARAHDILYSTRILKKTGLRLV
jgi:siroheme decarboxylase